MRQGIIVVARIGSVICFILAFLIAFGLDRIEGFLTLVTASIALRNLSRNWRLELKTPELVILAANSLRASSRFLEAGLVTSFLAAWYGLAFNTGFSTLYGVAWLSGAILSGVGIGLSARGMWSARRKISKEQSAKVAMASKDVVIDFL
jgi:hypothetical protein